MGASWIREKEEEKRWDVLYSIEAAIEDGSGGERLEEEEEEEEAMEG